VSDTRFDDVASPHAGELLASWQAETNEHAFATASAAVACDERDALPAVTAGGALASRDERRRLIGEIARVARDRNRHTRALLSIAVAQSWARGASAAGGGGPAGAAVGA
jgi:hypothetical protein